MSGNLNLCRVPGCITYLERGMLMCPEHWKQLPKWRRNAIVAARRDRRVATFRRLLAEALEEMREKGHA